MAETISVWKRTSARCIALSSAIRRAGHSSFDTAHNAFDTAPTARFDTARNASDAAPPLKVTTPHKRASLHCQLPTVGVLNYWSDEQLFLSDIRTGRAFINATRWVGASPGWNPLHPEPNPTLRVGSHSTPSRISLSGLDPTPSRAESHSPGWIPHRAPARMRTALTDWSPCL